MATSTFPLYKSIKILHCQSNSGPWTLRERLRTHKVFDPTPDFPQFCYMLGANLGSLLYGDVSVMELQCEQFESARNKTLQSHVLVTSNFDDDSYHQSKMTKLTLRHHISHYKSVGYF